MKIENNAITGIEITTDYNSPYSALFQFYRDFNNRDINLMSTNWIKNDEACMSNPLGGLKRGWQEIESVYNTIFSGPALVYVEFYDYTIHQTDSMFCAAGRERGYFILNDSGLILIYALPEYIAIATMAGDKFIIMAPSTTRIYFPGINRP